MRQLRVDDSISTMDQLGKRILVGNRRAIARGLSIVERGGIAAETIIETLYPHTGNAQRIGITGSPGAGKSSLVNALAKEIRKSGQTVAILAVDPTSPFTGGALLGDRVRMNDLYGDKGVFIRSMASRGQLGGLAKTTQDLVKVFDAGGFDMILIETVGAGQAEIEIAKLAHTTIVVEAPGLGDDIQSIKAGILEIADILVVNKADRAGAINTKRALQNMLNLGRQVQRGHHGMGEMAVLRDSAENIPPSPAWEIPVLTTVATESTGVAELSRKITQHFAFLQQGDGLEQGELLRSKYEVEAHITQMVRNRWHHQGALSGDNQKVHPIVQAVAQRKQTPLGAAQHIFDNLFINR